MRCLLTFEEIYTVKLYRIEYMIMIVFGRKNLTIFICCGILLIINCIRNTNHFTDKRPRKIGVESVFFLLIDFCVGG